MGAWNFLSLAGRETAKKSSDKFGFRIFGRIISPGQQVGRKLSRQTFMVRMDAVKVLITSFLGYDPQPGIVELELVDAAGRTHTFVEKTPVVFDDWGPEDHLMTYPRPGLIACTITGKRVDACGREVVTISTENPWVVISTEDRSEFEVYSDQLTRIP